MKRIEAINDFVIKFANVNGSGSASANELFAKAILRMGVPVSPRNIFPSNIQGLPTWYEARVCEQGYQGRRGWYVVQHGKNIPKGNELYDYMTKKFGKLTTKGWRKCRIIYEDDDDDDADAENEGEGNDDA